jgi:hypothetical protein
MTSQKPAKICFPASAGNDFCFLTRPPLLRSESEQEFNQLLSGLKAEIQPQGIIENMYVADIAIIVWEILRLRRCKVTMLNAAFRQALKDIILESSWQQIPEEHRESGWELKLLGSELSDRERESLAYRRERGQKLSCLADQSFSSKNARQKVSNILRRSQQDEFTIEARAIQTSAKELDWLETMLTTLELRRNKVLRRIAKYRESFADRIRATSDRIVYGESVELAGLEDRTKESGA